MAAELEEDKGPAPVSDEKKKQDRQTKILIVVGVVGVILAYLTFKKKPAPPASGGGYSYPTGQSTGMVAGAGSGAPDLSGVTSAISQGFASQQSTEASMFSALGAQIAAIPQGSSQMPSGSGTGDQSSSGKPNQAGAPNPFAGLYIDTNTGRTAYSGPHGEGGYGGPQAGQNLASWVDPTGKTVWYQPGVNIQQGNLNALHNYAAA